MVAALQILVTGVVIYQSLFAPRSRTGGYDLLLLSFALVVASLALALLFGALSALVKGLKNRWRFHR